MARDALGEIFTEQRGGRLVSVRRLIVARSAVEGILAEVSSAMKLSSASILRPLDASADGGLVTIVTETTEGRTLRGLLTTLELVSKKPKLELKQQLVVKEGEPKKLQLKLKKKR